MEIDEERRRYKEESKPDERYEIIVVSMCAHEVYTCLSFSAHENKTLFNIFSTRFAQADFSMCTPAQTPITNTSEWKILFLEILFVFHSVTLEASYLRYLFGVSKFSSAIDLKTKEMKACCQKIQSQQVKLPVLCV